MTVRVSVDVRSNLDATQPQFTNATFQFAGREIGILQAESSQTDEVLGMITNNRGDVIIQPARDRARRAV